MTSKVRFHLKYGSASWNRWREEEPDTPIVLDQADLNLDQKLIAHQLLRVSLRGASLHAANLMNADLRYADFTGANLVEADLIAAKLQGAILTGANLREADMLGAALTGAQYTEDDLDGALHLPLEGRR
jgi:uncharacterized protein YjbI with pentapeptide repeats